MHYHLALKLSKKRRFELVRNSIYEKQGISVHFQQWATFYYDAFTYVTKHDQYYVTSHGHPPLSNSPLTRSAVQGKRRASTNSSPATPDCQGRNTTENKGKKRLRLESNSLYQLVVANNIKSDLELCALSKVQYDEGKRDLNRYVMSTAESKRIEMLKTTWKIQTSKETLERAKKTRLTLLADVNSGEHVFGCDGRWLNAALQVLELNNIQPSKFAGDVRELLQLGRGKGRNILIYGETNCAKSFILMPLINIFDTFMCPANNKFNWVGAWAKEIIFLNDLNYSEEHTMQWGNFLNLLEGAPVSIGVPKNHFSEDVMWNEATPIFATAARPITRIVSNNIDHTQTNMMAERWKLFHFTHQFHTTTRTEYDPCGKCFASLILDC